MARPQSPDYDKRRETIVSTAADLFAANGFLGTSVSQIASACDMSKSLLYHYYPSKEDILQAVMRSHIDRLIETLEDTVKAHEGAEAQLRTVLRGFMADYVGAAARQKVLLADLDNLPGEARDEIVAKQRQIIATTQKLLIKIRPELADDPGKARAQTMLLFGMINWTGNWYDPKGPISPDQIADMAFSLITK